MSCKNSVTDKRTSFLNPGNIFKVVKNVNL